MSETQNKAVALATQIEGQLVNRLGMLTPYRRPILALTYMWNSPVSKALAA